LKPFTNQLRELFEVDQAVPRLDGSLGPYINFDNAASTPPLRAVEAAVRVFMPWYSSVHRGAGFKSQLATHAYEQARALTLRFVGADPATHVCIFGKNATEGLNKVARRLRFDQGRDVVIVTTMEHHSNDLPYRAVAHVVHAGVTPTGELDEADFDRLLAAYAGRVALVAVSGASNVTGVINPARRLAAKAHAAGAQILVDCAQLVPHRAVDVGALDDPGHFDYIVFSAHKLYAPYGTGALVARRDTLAQGEPDLRGGGTVKFVTEDSLEWGEPPDRDEAGSPNVVGAVALAAAIEQLQALGMDQVAAHEAELTAYALERLRRLEAVEVIGDCDPARAAERLGVIPFNVRGVPHVLAAAVLGHEFGIAVRNGTLCARPYTHRLLGLTPVQVQHAREALLAGAPHDLPGLVRASFGLYNTRAEVDVFVDALARLARGDYRGRYHQDPATGDYVPEGWTPAFERYFSLTANRT
jgi:selenocysteine lyase/cysteine desulfurase